MYALSLTTLFRSDDDSGLEERPSTGDEGWRDRTQRPVASPALNEVLFGEQGDGGQCAARPLDRVLDREDLQLPDGLAPNPEGFLEHRLDRTLGMLAGGVPVELHDDAVLGRIVGDRVADRRRHG